jgi:hypothetical protein
VKAIVGGKRIDKEKVKEKVLGDQQREKGKKVRGG